MELKTLKDLETLKYRKIIKFPSNYIKKSELKAEAIKWVKDIYPKFTYKQMLNFPRGGWIIDFFNLTEEDLK